MPWTTRSLYLGIFAENVRGVIQTCGTLVLALKIDAPWTKWQTFGQVAVCVLAYLQRVSGGVIWAFGTRARH